MLPRDPREMEPPDPPEERVTYTLRDTRTGTLYVHDPDGEVILEIPQAKVRWYQVPRGWREQFSSLERRAALEVVCIFALAYVILWVAAKIG